MSEKDKKVKKDPLLGDEENVKEPDQPVQPKVEAKVEKPVEKPVEQPKAPAKAKAGNKDTIVNETKDILAKSPHVNFIIPLSEGEPEGAFDTVQINGEYRLTIKKGVMVNIPMPVANILAEKYRINMTAGKDKRIDRTSEVEETLG